MREALDAAAGSLGPEEAAAVVEATLTPEETEALRRRWASRGTDDERARQFFGRFGRKMAEVVIQQYSNVQFLVILLCFCIRSAGVSRGEANPWLGIAAPLPPWEASRAVRGDNLPSAKKRSRANGKRDYRKWAPDKMRKYLLDNSAPTCDYVTPKKKRTLPGDPAGDSEPSVKRALTNSRHQL